MGVFPALTSSRGGVQISGRTAWEGIAARWQNPFDACVLFRYGERDGEWRPGTAAVAARSRLGTIWAALGRRWPADAVLVWHLSLLRLLPFFRLRGARVVLFLHGVEAWRGSAWSTRRLLPRVHLFLSNSEHTWRRFVDAHPRYVGAVHRTVHLGIGTPVAGGIPSPAHPPIALMVGRLRRGEDYKGHREMIAAWPLVLERLPDAELWIVGDGDLRPDLEKLVRARCLESRIRFLGEVPEQDKEGLFARCRCLVMPSREEGFGLVYVEAMRMGRPCLVSTVDAGREVVNPPEAGLAADPADVSQLADATYRLLSDGSEWHAWSQGARRRYEAYFTAERFQDCLVSAVARPL